MSYVYRHPNDKNKTIQVVYVPLENGKIINFGCSCDFCIKNPHLIPKWDTLVVPLDGTETWTVHAPEIATTFRILR